jgi:hypothetical protein
MTQPNRINSSSAHVTLKGQDWLRKTEADNVTWIPLFAEYYYNYRAVDGRWWFCDENGKFKIPDAPDIESIYREIPKP